MNLTYPAAILAPGAWLVFSIMREDLVGLAPMPASATALGVGGSVGAPATFGKWLAANSAPHDQAAPANLN